MTKVQLDVTENGFMILVETEEDFESFSVELPNDWLAKGSLKWLCGLPISVKVDATEPHQAKVVLTNKDKNSDLIVFEGAEQIATQVAQLVRLEWRNSNRLTSQAPAQGRGRYHKALLVGSITLGLFVLGGTAFFVTQKTLIPNQQMSSLDLSSMPLDQLAVVDQNPRIVKGIQEEMLQAVQIGKQKAAEEQGKIPDEHLKLLESMGLDASQSMQSAAACLSTL